MSGKKVFWIIGGAIVSVIAVAIGAWIIVTQNIETPDYTTVVKEGSFEIRDYPEMIVRKCAAPAPATKPSARRLTRWPTTFSRESAGAAASP